MAEPSKRSMELAREWIGEHGYLFSDEIGGTVEDEERALAALLDRVRREALEEAAKLCDPFIADTDGGAYLDGHEMGRQSCADAIRALIERGTDG